MSVSGARKSKELTEKYTAMVHGRAEKITVVRSTRRISFCPICKSYIAPNSKCGNCGYEPEEYSVIKRKLLRGK